MSDYRHKRHNVSSLMYHIVCPAKYRRVIFDPALPAEALDDAFRKLTRPEGAELVARSRALHRLLVDGVTVEYRTAEGEIRGAQARVIDFDTPSANDWLAVNQFSVTENKQACRPDVVLFVNGLPLAVVELKNAADESATLWSAWQQLQTYKAESASLFASNALLAISDGVEVRVGTLTAGREWFKPWLHHRGRGPGRSAPAGAAGGDQGALCPATLPRSGARLHRLRGRRRPCREEDGGLPPVPRGAGGGGRDAARRRAAPRRRSGRGARRPL